MADDPTTEIVRLTDAEKSWGIGIAPARGSTLMFSEQTVARIKADAYAAGMAAAHEGVEAMPTWRIKRPGDPTKEPVYDDFVLRSDLRALTEEVDRG